MTTIAGLKKVAAQGEMCMQMVMLRSRESKTTSIAHPNRATDSANREYCRRLRHLPAESVKNMWQEGMLNIAAGVKRVLAVVGRQRHIVIAAGRVRSTPCRR